jgi:hypothetical protein
MRFEFGRTNYPEIIGKKISGYCRVMEKKMSDERLRPELIDLFRQAKPGKPKITLTQEEFESLVERLRALRDQVQEDNEQLVRILRGKR